MKKILSIALVALLAASTVFAGFTGKASINLGYNLEKGTYGFANDDELKITFEATSENAGKDGEGSIFAGIKASFSMKQDDVEGDDYANWEIKASVDEAYVKGEDWSVSILGSQGSVDFAASAVDKTYSAVPSASLVATSVKAGIDGLQGFTATVKDWTVSAGLESTRTNATGYALPDAKYVYTVAIYDNGKIVGTGEIGPIKADEFNAAVAGVIAEYEATISAVELPNHTITAETISKAFDSVEAEDSSKTVKYPLYSLSFATPEFKVAGFKFSLGGAFRNNGKTYNATTAKFEDKGVILGVSGKATYTYNVSEGKDLVASIASDVVYDGKADEKKDEKKFVADLAAKVTFSGSSLDVYYANRVDAQNYFAPNKSYAKNNKVNNLLSVKVTSDLKEFGVPVKVTVVGRDLVNTQVIETSVSSTIKGVTIGAGFNYGFKAEAYKVSGNASYTFKGFTFAGGVAYTSAKVLTVNASVETSELIPGATIKLAYAPTSDTNLLNGKYGKVDATCTIAF